MFVTTPLHAINDVMAIANVPPIAATTIITVSPMSSSSVGVAVGDPVGAVVGAVGLSVGLTVG